MNVSAVNTMKSSHKLCLTACLCLPFGLLQAAELTGRASLFGAVARAEQGDAGYMAGNSNTLTADQQSLRLMLDGLREADEWSLHLTTSRQHLNGMPTAVHHSSELFRYQKLSGNWLEDRTGNSSTRVAYELDRAVYRHRLDDLAIGLGRQPIDWGSGRFWQPLNVLGSFAPTDLDTDFKPGIDAAVIDWYPSVFSSITAVYAWAPVDNAALENSGAVRYRSKTGDSSELSALAGKVIGNDVWGASLESEWQGMGWRIEALRTLLNTNSENTLFWIAGLDYQFENGALIAVEMHDNSRGATQESNLAVLSTDSLLAYGLQQHMSRRLVGIAANKDLTPLLHGSYQLLLSPLRDLQGNTAVSSLHQVNLTYSLGDESDLLLSLVATNGKGLNQLGEPQSEFGHLPISLTLRWRLYF